MFYITQSNEELKEINISVRADVGIADVWLHKNIEQTKQTNEDGTESTVWTAEEVYFRHAASDTLEEELRAAFDEWWNYGAAYTGEPIKISLDERVSVLEDALTAMIMEGMSNE